LFLVPEKISLTAVTVFLLSPMKKYYDVSHQQKKEFLLYKLRDTQAPNNTTSTYIPHYSQDLFEHVLGALVDRHESLRTCFAIKDGAVQQVIHDRIACEIEYRDHGHEADSENTLGRLRQEFSRKPMDLEKAPLFRVGVVRFRHDRHYCIMSVHHAIYDDHSRTIVENEFRALYQACLRGTQAALAELPAQYSAYAQWQCGELSGKKGEAHRTYWLNCLAGKLPAKNLTTVFGNRRSRYWLGPDQSYRAQLDRELDNHPGGLPVDRSYLYGSIDTLHVYQGGCFRFVADPALRNQLEHLATGTKATLFVVLMSGLNILIHKLANQPDVIIATAMSTRTRESFWQAVGWMMGGVVCRNQVEPGKTVAEFVAEVNANFFEAAQHRVYPLERIAKDLDVPVRSVVPLDVNFRIIPGDNAITDFTSGHYPGGTCVCDISLGVNAFVNGIEFYCTYIEDLFPAAAIESMFSTYLAVLAQMARHPHSSIAELAIHPVGAPALAAG
jgi:hypothetical protein